MVDIEDLAFRLVRHNRGGIAWETENLFRFCSKGVEGFRVHKASGGWAK